MLNPTAIADPDNYGPDDIKGLFLRRYKKHVQEQVSGSFLERQVSKHPVSASPTEEVVYDLLAEARFLSFDQTRRAGQLLFKTVLEKALFSSPAACLATVRHRLAKLEQVLTPDADADRSTLNGIINALERIGPEDFAKLPLQNREKRTQNPSEAIPWGVRFPLPAPHNSFICNI